MRFARFGAPGSERPVVFDGETAFDLRPIASDINAAFLGTDFRTAIRDALSAARLDVIAEPPERIGSPIARPGAVICIGMNYAAHAAESGSAPPQNPVVFLKTPNTVAGPDDDVVIPRGSEKTDWEVELGVVIGKRAAYLASPEQSAEHIAGFVLANDVSERAFQLEISGGQWSKGKCAPGFAPIGPFLVTPDELDYGNLRLQTWVNGEVRQDSTSADMIFGVDFLIHHLSQYMTLEPGDLILTGTPQGVALSGRYPYLRPEDVVELEISGLGRQRQHFRAMSAD